MHVVARSYAYSFDTFNNLYHLYDYEFTQEEADLERQLQAG